MILFNTCVGILCGFDGAMYCCDALLPLHCLEEDFVLTLLLCRFPTAHFSQFVSAFQLKCLIKQNYIFRI